MIIREIIRLIIGIILLISSILIFILNILNNATNHAITFITIFTSISGLIIIIIFLYRSIIINRLINNKDIITIFNYSNEEHLKNAQIELENNKNRNKLLLLLITFFFTIITSLFIILGIFSNNNEDISLFIILMLIILTIIIISGLISPYIIFHSSKNSIKKALISKYAIYYFGELHTNNPPFFKIESVKYIINKNILVFNISYLTLLGWFRKLNYELIIPVPNNYKDKAILVVEEFSN